MENSDNSTTDKKETDEKREGKTIILEVQDSVLGEDLNFITNAR